MATKNVKIEITAEDKTAAAFNTVKEKLSGIQKAVHGIRNSFTGSLFKFTAAMDAIRGFEHMTKAAYESTVQWQGMQYTLQAAGLTATQTNSELQYLQDTSLKLGINIKDVSSAFSRFVLTGHAAGESLPALNEQFKSISEAMRIFHLGSQQSTRSWLALTEIMAMGKVQSRQFTQQLGRDWPGIGALIAKALFPGKDSMAQFYAAMKEGKISSEEFMNAFNTLMAQPAMQGALGGAVNSIQAAMARLHTAWFNLTNEANNQGALDGMTSAINNLTTTMNDPAVKEGFDSLITGLAHLASWITESGAHVVNFLGDIGSGIGSLVTKLEGLPSGTESATADIARLKNEIASLQKQAAQPWYAGTSEAALQAEINQKKKMLAALEFGLAHPELTPHMHAAAPITGTPQVHGAPSLADTGSTGAIFGPLGASADFALARQLSANEAAASSFNASMKPLTVSAAQMKDEIAQMGVELKRQNVEFKDLKVAYDKNKQALQENIPVMSQFAIQAERNIENSTAKMFESIGQKGTTLKSILHSLFVSMEDDAANLLAKMMIEKAVSGMQGSSVSWVSSLGAIFGGGKASGGSVDAGHSYLVGEEGPELLTMGSPGHITPNHKLGGRSMSVNIDARGAGPDEVARLLAMRKGIINEMTMYTENRLQRGVWDTNRI